MTCLSEKDVKDHLKNVYGTLALCMVAAVAGVFINSIFVLYRYARGGECEQS